jgi:hypothetical protein
MSAHTPGPWKYRQATRTTHQTIGLGPRGLLVIKNEVSDADARLIAAAPDLLDTLRELVEIVDAAISAGDWKVDGCCDPSLSLDWARAAIAKAEGRA